ncbi:hypothetical protein D0Z07_9260 [Hyphodiscus hymeniophilus]|uniref:F-box domain-containing protein n=1 Tax=Hyphodiscus hymeniophilus TaxID=353542 RepID=A0A9P6SJM6_9HELO|nr:hypothetical protein D0Z07_9260 [Hyphodiscus hymeniophilus]
MAFKRRRSSASSDHPFTKKARTIHPEDRISTLSSEILIRILHLLPIQTLLQCQTLSHQFYTLAGDSQIWKNLYYNRFVLPRALRIPGIKSSQRGLRDDALHFSSRRSKWLDEETLVAGKGGRTTNWKKQYKLRHNWSIGTCEVQEIHVADRPSVPEMLVKLAEGVVVTADKEEGLRAWSLTEKELIAKCALGGDVVPTCLAVEEADNGLGVAVGFVDGGWGTWRLDVEGKEFTPAYRHPSSSNGSLGAVAYAHPYVLTITDAQLLSLYTFDPKPASLESPALDPTYLPLDPEPSLLEESITTHPSSLNNSQSTLLASLKSHTSWPPLSLSIRTTPSTLIASIAYSQPTYLSGYTIGLQELHLSLSTGLITFSRLASSLPQGFSSLLSSPSPGTASPALDSSSSGTTTGAAGGREGGETTRPTTLSYAHPYILATHPDNTLTLYLCTSSHSTLSISPGTKLWGHTSSVSSAEITPRGKAVSVSTRGDELRVWELEGGFGSASKKRVLSRPGVAKGLGDRSVRVRAESRVGDLERDGVDEALGPGLEGFREEVEARKQWVGFDDEVVIVLKESRKGTQALMVYDFT